jgi:hypothetical protein
MITLVALGLAGTTLVLFASKPRWQRELRVSLPVSWVEVAVVGAAALAVISGMGLLMQRRRRTVAFAIAWAGSALLVATTYHGDVVRRNAAYDYPGLYARLRPALDEAPVVATWGLHDLPLSFYSGRRAVAVETDRDLRKTLASDRRAVAIVTERALGASDDGARLTRLGIDRFASEAVWLVRDAGTSP